MADGTTSFSVSPEGDPYGQLMAQVREAAAGAYDVLGEMGRSKSGNVVYLARELETGNLVAMKLSRAGEEFSLEVVRTLDGAVPGLENKCPECKSILPDWDRFCFRCGADLSAVSFTPGADEAAQLLDAVKEATAGEYEIIGKMDRSDGGGAVFFARDLKRGKLVALRLRKDESGDPSQAAYSIGETQVFRPLAAELGATQVAPAGYYTEPERTPPPAAPPPPPPEPVAFATPGPEPEPVATSRPPTRAFPVKLVAGIGGAAVIGLVAFLALRDPGAEPAVAPSTPPPAEPASASQPPPPPPPPPPPEPAADTTAVAAVAGADSGTVVIGVPLPTGARLTIDGRAARGARLRVAAGTHTLAVTAAGYQPVQERVTVRGDGTLVWRPALAQLQAGPAPTPPPAPPPASSTVTCSRAASRADWTQALELCQKEAAAGDAVAQRLLARMFENGTGTAKNAAEAFQWFTKAAAGGDREAQERLGYLYRDGVGTGRDEAKSAMFFRQAAEGGRAAAQLELGVALEDGKGVKEDDKEAAQWYEKASGLGSSQAARRLGRLYERGQGVPKSDADAARWYRVAADRGDRDAQYFLGRFYKDGKGVEKSAPLALEWFKKAAAQGHKDAESEARKLEKP